jgi:hypothetical protein
VTQRLSPSGPFLPGGGLAAKNRLNPGAPVVLNATWQTVLGPNDIGLSPVGATMVITTWCGVQIVAPCIIESRFIAVDGVGTEQSAQKTRTYTAPTVDPVDFSAGALLSVPPTSNQRQVSMQMRLFAGAPGAAVFEPQPVGGWILSFSG